MINEGLSSSVLKKREKIIQNMLNNKKALVQRYGSEAEKVMYGRATTSAKNQQDKEMKNTKLKEMIKATLMGPVDETNLDEKKAKKDFDGDGKIESSEEEYKGSRDKAIKKAKAKVDEDLDLGHEDNEPHHIKSELYKIGKYSMELYNIMEELETKGGEIDLPAWWQSKITKACTMIGSAKHYLEFEINEPKVDALVDRLTDKEPSIDEPEIELDEKLTAKTPMKTYIKDFATSDAPQFKGKSKEKKRQMAIAAKLAKQLKESSVEEGFLDRIKANIKGVTSQTSTKLDNLKAFVKGDKDAIKDPNLAKDLSKFQSRVKSLDKDLEDVIKDISILFPKDVLVNTPEEFQAILNNYIELLEKTKTLNTKMASGDLESPKA